MKKRIESHVNELFAGMPQDNRILEVKEELLSNLGDKFDDYVKRGKSEEEAYSLVVSSIGDIHGLLTDVMDDRRYEYQTMEKKRNVRNLFISIGTSLYIVGFAAVILLDPLWGDAAAAIMFSIWAIATGFVVYGSTLGKSTTYKGADDSFVEQYKEKESEKTGVSELRRAVTSSLWSIIVVVYLAVSFFTNHWEFTWIIFLVGVVLQNLAGYVLVDKSKRRHLWHGTLWSCTLVLYFVISYVWNAWPWSWMVFLVAAALQQVIRLALLVRNVD